MRWIGANLESVGGDPYTFSKEVVRVWGMRHSRKTMARGVRTNSLCPGPMDTPLLRKHYGWSHADLQASWDQHVASGGRQTVAAGR